MNTEKKVDAKVLKAAQEVAKNCQVAVVYRNSRGEFFTSLNAAENSDKKENIETYDFTAVQTKEAASDAGDGKKVVKLAKKDMDKYPELAKNGWKAGDEVEELDWALVNKKPDAQA